LKTISNYLYVRHISQSFLLHSMEIIFTIFVHLGRKMEDEKNSVKYKQLILVSRYGQKVVPVHTVLEYSVLARLSAHTAWISCLHLP